MTSTMTQKVKTKDIWRFLAWTFGWTWGLWGAGILLKSLWPDNPLTNVMFLIGSFGPMAASLIVLKKKSLKDMASFLFSGRKGAWLYLLIYGGALTLTAALAASGRLADGALANLPLSIIIVALTGGGNEEPGWRGFLQPALETRFSFPLATLIVGAVWAIWHVPLWFFDRGESSFPLFFVSCLIFAVWFAGLYKKTQSLLVCILFHALINTVPESFIGIGEAMGLGDFSQINSLFYLGGIAIMTLYSIYLWYQADRKQQPHD